MYKSADSNFSDTKPGTQYQSFQFMKLNQKLAGRNRVASGTGFFVNSDGYLLTNAHVVFDPHASYVVLLSSGREVEAEVILRDTANDLGILKIPGGNYPSIDLGNSSALKVGSQVMGIGNAFGEYDYVMSEGMISGLGRSVIATGPLMEERLDGLIETDATMYPGDSGGPLFDSKGKVVGINVAVSEDSSQSFAIPINVAKKIISRANIDL
jgi:serine protease Do